MRSATCFTHLFLLFFAGQIVAQTLTLKGHSDRIHDVAFSPDGKKIASGSGDRTVKVWDAKTGLEMLTFKGHTEPVYSLAFSPDGRQIASASGDQDFLRLFDRDKKRDNTVRVWDAKTGREMLTLEGHFDPIHSVAFSADGKRIASGSGFYQPNFGGKHKWRGTVKVWDARTGRELLTFKRHAEQVNCVAFSPDGKQIASGGYDCTIRVWDAKTGLEMLTFNGHSRQVYSLAFSPDGKQVASGGYDRTIKVWDAVTGQETLTFKGHTDWVSSVAFSPDGKQIASGGYDRAIKVWDAKTGRETLTLEASVGVSGVSCLAFSPDGERLASGYRQEGLGEIVTVWPLNMAARAH
ncbi:WD40 repeat domain-containing protein [Crocinitomicaceae bacterium]|nr:WD40 repeat domain-containing protein [Crocinitomicaceae bacterium]